MTVLLNMVSKKEKLELVAKSDDMYELTLYGAIGESWFEESVTAKNVINEIKKIPDKVKEIQVRLNSPGGSVFDGITIYERLRQHKAKKTVYVDGVAASIASIIAMAGDEIHVGEGSFIMIHRPMTGIYGNAAELEKTIDILDKIENQMIAIYSRKTGLSNAEVSKLMSEETWFNADESLDKGFATNKTGVEANLRMVASALKNGASWIKKTPNLAALKKKDTDLVAGLKNRVEQFLARK